MTATSPRPSRDRNALGQRLALWLRGTVVPLVVNEACLEVECVWAGETLALVIRTTDAADRARLVGKLGRTATALRRLVSVAGARAGVNAVLDIDDGNGDGRGASPGERA